MKAPGFWWAGPGFAAGLLAPAAAIYGAVAARRMARTGAEPPVPIVCIGNVTVGGAGKTPAAIAVAALLRDAGRRPAFLTRGHGGRLAGPVRVDPATHDSDAVGDEPLLLARHAPTIVSRDRPAGAALAAASGGDVIIMDDGLQNPSLRKALTLAVFDGAVGIGNGRVLPAGPLRAPLAAQWPRIDAVLVVGPGASGDAVAREAGTRGLPVLHGALRPDPAAAAELAGQRVLALAGIGRPAKFFDTLRAVGAEIGCAVALPDHHRFSRAEIGRWLDRAERDGLVPVTTEKDAVRLAVLAATEPRIAAVRAVPVQLVFAEPEAVGRLLRAGLEP